MTKKRGRPPKSPSPSSTTSNETQRQGLDLLELDDEDLTDIDGLSPKQADKLLENLEAIRLKLQEKTSEPLVQVVVNNEEVLNKEAEPTRIASVPSVSKPPSEHWDKEEEGYAMFRRKIRKISKSPATGSNECAYPKDGKRSLPGISVCV
ncbi:hypothetical protein RIF29_03511 [Crotalaria pallida]|uniref:Uncharacterized protein n=1 Tax=Crotalaria pallida TaxID=3830 RepID=A0AAN9J0W8_CROPI